MGCAAFDRRIQAGPANFALRVRCGEPSWTELADRIAEFRADRFLLVADEAAPTDHLSRVHALAAAQAPCTVVTLPDGPDPPPAHDGRTVVIALGGQRACAVPADLRLPTTLAAACGPALALLRPPVGSRTGPAATLPARTDQARTAPALVWVRSDVLAARPPAETRAGMVEVIRHVLAVCPAQYEALAKILCPSARYTPQALAACVALCADARSTLVCFDPFENGPALALGYGRGLAGAVRSSADAAASAALAPGDAEALGLLLAARVAAHLGLLDGAALWAHRELLARNGSATALPDGTDARALAVALTAAARPGLLLLDGLGWPHCSQGRLLTRVDAATLRAAAESLGRPGVPHSRGPAAEPVPASAGRPG
ncbi:hypothetical protein ACFVHB_03420 [Kitasatospora sp. NPDC127111]|uniref:3-dehydroquinate synthase family protein n=1 Tax=Kitasatospora sp. NPDC127111 TaxID=3345363 RepID=UPI0036372631